MAIGTFLRNTAIAAVLTAAGAMSANAAIVSNSDVQSFEAFGFLFSGQTAPSAPIPGTQNHNDTLNLVRIEFNQTVNSTISVTGGNCAFAFTQSGSVALGTAIATAATIIDPDTVNCDIGGGNACFLSTHARNSPYTEAIDFTAASDVANFVVVGTFLALTDLIADYLASLTPERPICRPAWSILGAVRRRRSTTTRRAVWLPLSAALLFAMDPRHKAEGLSPLSGGLPFTP
jgi:hypothetical protein